MVNRSTNPWKIVDISLRTASVVLALVILYRTFVLNDIQERRYTVLLGIVILALFVRGIIRVRAGEGSDKGIGARMRNFIISQPKWRLAVLAIVLLVVCYGAFNSIKFSMTMRAVQQGNEAGSSPTIPTVDFENIVNQYPVPGQLETTKNTSTPVGSCVNVTGGNTDARVVVVPCGSPENNYRVIQQAAMPNECVADADRRYYHNGDDGEWTACMDLAWTEDSCLNITREEVKRVSCDNTEFPKRQKPVKVILNSTSIDSCATRGFAHPVRRFTVCTQIQK